MSRRVARENVLLSLYSLTIRGDNEMSSCKPKRDNTWHERPQHIPVDDYQFALQLYSKTAENIEKLDDIIKEYSTNWDIERISIIDRNILRMSLAELLFFEDISGKITINEAVELAKKYGGEDSPRFINGILDAVMKNVFGDKAQKE
ncbi:MAG: transcription antitermination factor NusB [Candidatus Zixiibacteriota bacterium]